MQPKVRALLAAAENTSAASVDMIEAARDGGPRAGDNVSTGETLMILADAMRLLMDTMPGGNEDRTQLQVAVIRYL
jgi:hypothetical protein